MDGEVTAPSARPRCAQCGTSSASTRTRRERWSNSPKPKRSSASDYYQFTSLINRRFTQPQKERIVELMWEVAYADAAAHPYEEHLIRKLADLLYVEHHALHCAKLKARDASRLGRP